MKSGKPDIARYPAMIVGRYTRHGRVLARDPGSVPAEPTGCPVIQAVRSRYLALEHFMGGLSPAVTAVGSEMACAGEHGLIAVL